jgi:hypothetical protein
MAARARRIAPRLRVTKPWLAKAMIFGGAAVVTSVFFINFCALVYQCGCESLWAGAADSCNIHDAGSRHCPWCSIGTAGTGAVWAAIVGAQAAVVFLWPGIAWLPRTLLALLAFPLIGGILAVGMGLAKGYWL